MRQCRNCGKRIPDKLTFCSKECAQEMENKFKNSFPISAEIREEEKVKTKSTISYESNLRSIYDFLDLNEAKDGRLVIKADIMKKVIFLTSKWNIGKKREWIDKLSILTCVSTRKMREDYIQPLITMGILGEFGEKIRFVGLPKLEVSF
ncbi:MAG: hypothetical protein P8X97_08335 [Candidatus Bathyarchaeota archaeon]